MSIQLNHIGFIEFLESLIMMLHAVCNYFVGLKYLELSGLCSVKLTKKFVHELQLPYLETLLLGEQLYRLVSYQVKYRVIVFSFCLLYNQNYKLIVSIRR